MLPLATRERNLNYRDMIRRTSTTEATIHHALSEGLF